MSDSKLFRLPSSRPPGNSTKYELNQNKRIEKGEKERRIERTQETDKRIKERKKQIKE